MDFSEVIAFDALYDGLQKAQRNVLWKDSVAAYSLDGLKNTYLLRKSLLDGSYRISAYQVFSITEPKEREIVATNIKDRQFQRSLCDNVLYPELTKRFIRDNCACQKNRGTYDALKRLYAHLQSYARKHKSNEGYVLQCDIQKFFPSTKHSEACKIHKKYIKDDRSCQAACDVIRSFIEPQLRKLFLTSGNYDKALVHQLASTYTYEGKLADEFKLALEDVKGIGLGSQVSQLTELSLLNGLDHYIKEQLHIKHYIRYMDDFILIHHDKEHLKHCLEIITKRLEHIGLKLNPKTHIYKINQGVTFLKWRMLLLPTGKVVVRKDRKRITAQRRKMRKLKRMLDAGVIKIEDVRNNFQSWQSCVRIFKCYSLIIKMRKYYYNLFKEKAPRWKK